MGSEGQNGNEDPSITRDNAYGISKTHTPVHTQPSQTEPLYTEGRRGDELKWHTQGEVSLGLANLKI